ncbi:hypothetical protein KWK98_003290 [Clostridioides difficile]|uniref:hypothetical protein n=1 Tax=Clostridioides difficile TaxID=1496 RepID=UPI001A29017B|nr:hypothetical protein [Clostridioides difficile]EGT4600355.1 hypothetical protein [Clostridioides difficile]EGT5562473.1 hypothetical protein [Clostridioides difficile]EJA6846679.1 hypothetical protein [Clostridioides difficile]ELX4589533.1 hypothetical protein [Clostridioides difficile]MBH7537181.1 hypothetical protein [Clostridioides difficile]
MQIEIKSNTEKWYCKSATNSYTTESKIDQDIIDKKGTTQLGYGDNHRGRVTIGSTQYVYTRRLKDPFLVQDGENPYIYTLETEGLNINI